ncbi:hypothetical protein MTO96_013734 [Rhipicephalus appendiculatus]
MFARLWETKTTGGYHDVLVAIDETTEPNETVVEAVKVLLRAASRSLHRATGGRVHLASVTLAIPRHWPRRPGVQQVPYDPWSRADIRVVDGYQLAREWARYRYGVLGEFATTGDVCFPAACTNASEEVSGGQLWGDKPCDPMSAWQLITGSDDFKGLDSSEDNEPIETTFREIQQNISIGRHLVMVFDVSDADKVLGDVTVTKLKETVALVLVDKLPEGTLVSLVYFVNGSSFHAGPMTLIKASQTDIANLVLLTPIQGPTCTLCGLKLALQVLISTTEQSPEGSLVILFSDGKATDSSLSSTEEDPGYFLGVVPYFQRERVTITTVAVGATASRHLEKLALQTGGRTYALCDINAEVVQGRCWMGVVNAFFDTTYELLSAADSSRSKSMPNHYGIGDGRSSGLLQARSVLCLDEPIRLRVRVPQYVDTYRAAVVLATLTKGQCPVVHANVKGLAFFQNSSTGEEFLLHDSGLGEDVHANDGTYTGQFTKFRGKGRYTIVIKVSNKSQTEFLDWATNNVPEQIVRSSRRTCIHWQFSNWRAWSFNGRLLRNISGAPVARISWTMPGAHAFEGTVSSIDVRSSRSTQTMLNFFPKATAISEQDLVSGSMKPLPAFSRQLATVYIPSTVVFGHSPDEATGQAPSASGYDVYFALVTTNADGSRSEVSNLASVRVPANFTVPAGIASAGAALLVPENIPGAKNDSEGTDTSPPPETTARSPSVKLLSIPVSSDTDTTHSAANETSHEETPLETKKTTISKKTTRPRETTFPTTKNKKKDNIFHTIYD